MSQLIQMGAPASGLPWFTKMAAQHLRCDAPLLAPHRLVRGKQERPRPLPPDLKLLLQHAALFAQVVDRLGLLPIDPAGEGGEEDLQGMGSVMR